MAYNNNSNYNNYDRNPREWDQEKGYVYEQYEGNTGRVRPREDEYNDYGGGYEKRRRYDNGVRSIDFARNYHTSL